MTVSKRRPVVVHIDELDFSGVPVARRPAVAAAFSRELRNLLAAAPPVENLVLSANGNLSLSPLPVALTAPPERVGAALAVAVHAGLTGSRPVATVK